MQPFPNPMIIGHRGAAGEAPENTISSFLLAAQQGAHAIELDVNLTCDGEIVVIHDETLERTTSGKGHVNELTLKEIKQYDAGLWFHERFEGETVPTLEEVFERVSSDLIVNIELKGKSEKLEIRLAEILQLWDRVDTVFLSSFRHKKLAKIKRLIPEIRIGLGYRADVVNHLAFAQTFGQELYSLHPHYKLIGLNDIQYAVQNALHVYPYTVNETEDMLMLLKAGASGLITDYPGRMHALLQRWA